MSSGHQIQWVSLWIRIYGFYGQGRSGEIKQVGVGDDTRWKSHIRTAASTLSVSGYRDADSHEHLVILSPPPHLLSFPTLNEA